MGVGGIYALAQAIYKIFQQTVISIIYSKHLLIVCLLYITISPPDNHQEGDWRTKGTIMTTLDAWQYIVSNWYTSHWIPVPDAVKSALGLDTRLGLYSGMLVSRAGAQGITEFVSRINSK